jgi:hypothetical protein
MNEFTKQHQDCIHGTLTGFDRVLFRGTLRSISYLDGVHRFLCAKGILMKDFMAFAEDCTERLMVHAKQLAAEAERPYIYLQSSAASKEDTARRIITKDGLRKGLVCVLCCVEPCMTFRIRGDRKTRRLHVVYTRSKCRFLYFYYLDREFGMMHIRLQSWFPFSVQVCINGRSYLQKQLDREGIGYQKRENCFTRIDDVARAQQLLSRLDRYNWPPTLSALVGRVNPLRRVGGPLADQRDYYWTTRQYEMATDVMFTSTEALERLYPSLCRHAITALDCQDVLRFFGRRLTVHCDGPFTSEKKRLVQGVRIKHRVEENSIKMYDKQGSILRIETTINNPRRFRVLRAVGEQADGTPALAWRKMCKGTRDMTRCAEIMVAANDRYLNALAAVGEPVPCREVFEEVSKPVRKGNCRYRALRPATPQDALLFEAILRGEHLLHGFTSRDVQAAFWSSPPRGQRQRRQRSGRVSRKLRLLRAHGLIHKVGKRRLYRITARGHRVMTAALYCRNADLHTLLEHAA